jgi:hypothetical protein
MIRIYTTLLCTLLWMCSTPLSWAHKPSDSYVYLDLDETTTLRWDIALRDLELAVGLDANQDGDITWGEVNDRRAVLFMHATQTLQLAARNQPCDLLSHSLAITEHTDGRYASLQFDVLCATGQADQLQYRLLFDLDPTHRGILTLNNHGTVITSILSPEAPTFQWSIAPSLGATLIKFVKEGIWHIWIGYDHILFLLALLLPAVVWRKQGPWQAQQFRNVITSVVGIVTSFTVAHSITLSLATLQWISLPSRWVEATIAASVVFAAMTILFPMLDKRRWIMAFCFGLIHGFGFAGVLGELGLPTQGLAAALAAFNVGVELGQLVIVASVLPIIYALRHTRFYRYVTLPAGALLIAGFGLVWFIERSFDITLIS